MARAGERKVVRQEIKCCSNNVRGKALCFYLIFLPKHKFVIKIFIGSVLF